MLAQERQNRIMEYLETNKIVKITNIVRQFHVSHETVRRDLDALQEQGLVRRIYGGAVLEKAPAYPSGRGEAPAAGTGDYRREAIGAAGAKLVNEGETILLAIGSTILEVARNIKGMKNITVLTSSVAVVNELMGSDLDIYVLGGKVNSDEQTMGGQLTQNALLGFFVDKAFIGAGGVTLEGGVSDYSGEESETIRCMMKRAREVILVAQSDKFGANSLSVTCPLSEIGTIVTDRGLSREYAEGIRERGIRLVLSGGDEGKGSEHGL